VKKLLIVGAIGLVALALVASAVATTPASHPSTFAATGKVERVFTTAAALKVHVRLGSAGVRPYIGRDLTMRVSAKATILSINEGVAHLIKLKGIKVGDRVEIDGRIDRSTPAAPVYVARLIKVRHWVPANQLTEFSCGGPVTAVDTTAGTVTLTVNSASRALWTALGSQLPVKVAADTKLFAWINGVKTPITLADVTPGAKIWTWGTIDRTVPTAPVYTAEVLTVRVPAPTT
jgi:hypothetical protein